MSAETHGDASSQRPFALTITAEGIAVVALHRAGVATEDLERLAKAVVDALDRHGRLL